MQRNTEDKCRRAVWMIWCFTQGPVILRTEFLLLSCAVLGLAVHFPRKENVLHLVELRKDSSTGTNLYGFLSFIFYLSRDFIVTSANCHYFLAIIL